MNGLHGKTVLVTGGTGFIGGRLVEKLVLEQGAAVRVLVRNFSSAPRIARFPIEMIPGELTDPAAVARAVEGCEAVFNCAPESGGKKGARQAPDAGVRVLAEAVLAARVPRLVHLSSTAVYGPTLDGDLTETTPWQPSSHPYTAAKRAGERLALELHRNQGLPVVVLQPAIVYGPFSKPWTLGPAASLKTGLVPLVNGGSGLCNAVYVDDVVEAMLLAATRPGIAGETFLISGDPPVTWKEFYGAYETALGLAGTVELSEEKLRALLLKQARQSGPRAYVLGLARHPRVFSTVVKLPPVSGSLKVLKRILPEERRQALKARFLPARARAPEPNGAAPRPVHLPNETLLELYRARTVIRIDKARDRLGYAPRFSFERGMALTAQYMRWAHLNDA